MLVMSFIQMTHGITDCDLLTQFASNLNVSSALMTQINNNCCTGIVTGVTCNSGQITVIDWSNKNLTGFIDGNMIPRGLTTLNLKLNKIQGLYPVNVPDTIRNLDLSHNQLVGPVSKIPNSIVTLFLSQNKLNGSFPVITGPLVNTDCSDNQFTGPLPAIPASVTNFAISRTFITGHIPFLPNINYLYLADNLMSGDVSVIRAGITEFWIQNNKFVGVLTLSRPTKFHVESNLIHEIVVSDTTAITVCNISNNPLLNSTSILNLGICTKINLFAYVPPPEMSMTDSTLLEMQTNAPIATRNVFYPLKSTSTQKASTKTTLTTQLPEITTESSESIHLVKMNPNGQVLILSVDYLVVIIIHVLVNGFFLGIVTLKMLPLTAKTRVTSMAMKRMSL
eukprot:NODE_158_length_15065_cov_0.349125.p4 type:complete len:394 gc:universal NODE_158_length_15065_cov_0.349125:8755-9936(+)